MKKTIFMFATGLGMAMSACCGGTQCDNNQKKCGNVCDSTAVCQNINCTPEERAGIEKAIDFYTDAAVKGDSKIAIQAFTPAATMSYAEGDSLVTVPIQALYDYYDQTGPHDATYEISACSVAGDVAMVRIESKFGEAEFSDMFTLVKDGSDWKIVSKVYHVK